MPPPSSAAPGLMMPGLMMLGMLGLCHRLLLLLPVLGCLAALPTSAAAGPYEDALSHFLTDDFDDTIEAVNAIAASGNPLAATVIEALQEERLFFSAADDERLKRCKVVGQQGEAG